MYEDEKMNRTEKDEKTYLNNETGLHMYSCTEKNLIEIWREMGNKELIDVNDNFFKLGGHSLLLMQFHVHLEKYFPGKVTIPDLFAYSTISKLAGYIDSQCSK